MENDQESITIGCLYFAKFDARIFYSYKVHFDVQVLYSEITPLSEKHKPSSFCILKNLLHVSI